jgi:serine/threonine-protein kinase
MREQILEDLVARGAAASSLAEQVRSRLGGGEALVSSLTAVGVDPEAVLDSAVRITGMPRVPSKWQRAPEPPPEASSAVDQFRRLGAVPVGTHKGQLCVAFADPEVARSTDAAALPRHRALLATPASVAELQARVFGPGGGSVPNGGLYEMRASQKVSVVGADTEQVPRLPTAAMQSLQDADADATLLDMNRRPPPTTDATIRVEQRYETNPKVEVALKELVTEPPTQELEAQDRPHRDPPPPARAQTGERRTLDDAREAALASLPRFRAQGMLGRGGMATVYLADDVETGSKVALKLIEPHLAEDGEFVERFRREVKASGAIGHENVVRLFDSGAKDGTLYMASEYVDGGTLRDLLYKCGGPMPVALVAPIITQAIAGLGAAHRKGIVHRDLKPANILITSGGVVKVGDFGVAKSQTDNTITQSGMLFGTPSYMSPEQAFGKTLDGRSDLFSMSTLAYELLTAQNPYHHENMSTSLLMVSKVAARPIFEACPFLPPIFEEVLARLMERERDNRYADAETVVEALRPLNEAIYRRYGNVVADAVADPVGTCERLRKEQAASEARRAHVALNQEPPRTREAAYRFFRVKLLDPDNPVVAQFLPKLVEEHGYRFTLETDAQLDELEEALAQKKHSPALLRRGADLCLKRNNLLLGTVWIRRYLRQQPTDTHMKHVLEGILGSDPISPFSQFNAPSVDEPASQVAPDTAPTEQVAALPDWGEALKGRGPPPKAADGGKDFKRLAIFAAVVLVIAALAGVVISVTRGSGAQAVTTDTDDEVDADTPTPPMPAPDKQALARQDQRFEKAKALVENGKLAEAVRMFGNALEADPGSDRASDILIARARTYVNLRRLDEARGDLDKAARLLETDDPRIKTIEQLRAALR